MLKIEEYWMSDPGDSALFAALRMAQFAHVLKISPRLPRTQRRYKKYLRETTPEERWASINAKLIELAPSRLLVPEGPYDLITSILGLMGVSAQHLVYWFEGSQPHDLQSIVTSVAPSKGVAWINKPARQSIPGHLHAHVIEVR